MKMLKLNHPQHGLCAQQVIHGMQSAEKIKRDWRKKYGRKFFECSVDFFSDEPEIEFEIYNYRTEEIYKTKHEAKLATGLTLRYIDKQLGRQLNYNSDYYLEMRQKVSITGTLL